MKNKNPYLLKGEELSTLSEKHKQLKKEYSDVGRKLSEIYQQYSDIINTCTHVDETGESTIEYTGQDPGSGRSEHKCMICNQTNF